METVLFCFLNDFMLGSNASGLIWRLEQKEMTVCFSLWHLKFLPNERNAGFRHCGAALVDTRMQRHIGFWDSASVVAGWGPILKNRDLRVRSNSRGITRLNFLGKFTPGCWKGGFSLTLDLGLHPGRDSVGDAAGLWCSWPKKLKEMDGWNFPPPLPATNGQNQDGKDPRSVALYVFQ